jgi:hypothetical protein
MLFTDEDFRTLIMQQRLSRYDNKEENDDGHWMRIAEFRGLDGFIREFKKRNGFRSRRGHFKRRPAINAEREPRWMEEIEELLGTVPCDAIYNADETSAPILKRSHHLDRAWKQ